MDALIDFIMGGCQDFTPEMLVRYMVFVLLLSCIGSIVDSVFSVGR